MKNLFYKIPVLIQKLNQENIRRFHLVLNPQVLAQYWSGQMTKQPSLDPDQMPHGRYFLQQMITFNCPFYGLDVLAAIFSHSTVDIIQIMDSSQRERNPRLFAYLENTTSTLPSFSSNITAWVDQLPTPPQVSVSAARNLLTCTVLTHCRLTSDPLFRNRLSQFPQIANDPNKTTIQRHQPPTSPLSAVLDPLYVKTSLASEQPLYLLNNHKHDDGQQDSCHYKPG